MLPDRFYPIVSLLCGIILFTGILGGLLGAVVSAFLNEPDHTAYFMLLMAICAGFLAVCIAIWDR